MNGPITMAGCQFPHGAAICGTVRNVQAREGWGDSVLVTFDLEACLPDEVIVVVYVDGLPVQALAPGVREAILTGLVADARLDLVPMPADTARYVRRVGDWSGARAFASWNAVTADDVRAYRLYWDAGDPEAEVTTLAAEVTAIEVDAIAIAAPTTGSCTGRIRFGGVWQSGTSVNGWLTVTITGTGTASWALGTESGTITFAQGQVVRLANGAEVGFLHGATAYITGCVFRTWVGVRTWWQSAVVSDGTYRFKVAAVDAANNEATATAVWSLAIEVAPVGATGKTISWTEATRTITLAWTNPVGGDFARAEVYSNWNVVTGELEASVIEGAPLWYGSAQTWSIAGAVDGNWKFYVRVRDTAGRLEDNVELLSLTVPYVPPAMGTPQYLRATALGAGTWRMTWDYARSTSDPVTAFRLFVVAEGDPWDYDVVAGSVTVGAEATPNVHEWTKDLDLSGYAGTTVWVRVRGWNGSFLGPLGGYVAVAVDTTAPDVATGFGVLPN